MARQGPKRAKAKADERVKTGIKGLDKLLSGGLVRDSTVMLRGDSGTGKSLFCLQYLYRGATEDNEPGVYISFSESEENLCKHASNFGWDLESLIKKNMLAIVRYEPHEVATIVSEGGGSLRDTVESLGAKRLVIDSLTAYEMVFETKYKANESVLSLFELLRKWDATVVVTAEIPVEPDHLTGGRLGFLTDGIINLYHVRHNSERGRGLEVMKMRDTNHDTRINVFKIGKHGLEMSGRWQHGRGR